MKRKSNQSRLASMGFVHWRLTALAWAALLILTELQTFSATLRWTGGHPTQATWSRPANWDTGTTPQDGDSIVFPAGAARLINNNDLVGLELVAIRFSGAGGGYLLQGNGVTITNSITATNSTGANSIALDRITLGKDLPFTVAQASTSLLITSEIRLNGHDLTANTTDLLRLDGEISGNGNLVKTGAGELRLGGSTGNSFSGTVTVNEGLLQMNKSSGLAVPHRLIIGDGAGGAQSDIAKNLASDQVNEVTVNGSGLWQLGNNTDEVSDLALNQGGDVTTGNTGLLRLGIGANVSVVPSLLNLPDAAHLSGNLELLLGTHLFTINEGFSLGTDPTELVVDAKVSGLGGITKEGKGDLLLSGKNTFAAIVHVNSGELRISDSSALGLPLSGTFVNNDASLWLQGDVRVIDEPLTLNSTAKTGTLIGVPALQASGPNNLWSGPITLQLDSSVGVVAAGFLELSGPISGTSGLTKENDGTLRLSGSEENTYSGMTDVRAGSLELNKLLTRQAIAGPLNIGDSQGGVGADIVSCLGFHQIALHSDVTMASSGALRVGLELIGSLSGAGRVAIEYSLAVGFNNTTTVFDGDITSTSSPGNIEKVGTGVWTLNGRGTHKEISVVSGGLVVNGDHSPVYCHVNSGGQLSGTGKLGRLFAGGSIFPGSGLGRLTVGEIDAVSSGRLGVELAGRNPGTQYDQLRSSGPVDLGGIALDAALQFIPTIGDSFTILDNTGTGSITDTFAGLPEGATLRLNGIPFVISYQGGDGNDVTLTATDHALTVSGTRIAGGNGDGIIQPNECNQLFIGLMNETSIPLSITRAVLDSTTPGVIVTQQRSDYPGFAALGVRTNATPYEFRTSAGFNCGQTIEFTLTVTVDGKLTFSIPLSLPTGAPGAAVRFDQGANLNLIDSGLSSSTLTVANAPPNVSKVAVSLHITHPSSGDLVLRLQSPSGTIVRLASSLGGTTDNYGTDCTDLARTTFDDAAPTKIAAATAPFVGSFTPESPLDSFMGEDPNGTWTLLINDTVSGDTGVLRCWSLLLSPPECAEGSNTCPSCLPTTLGRFDGSSSTTTQRLKLDGQPSGCGAPKLCPGSIAGIPLMYQVHTFTNSGDATCVNVVLTERCRTNDNRFHAAAYLGSYNPADPCTNYLGDTGKELKQGSDSFSFQVPAGGTFVVVVTTPAASVGGGEYSLELYGLPCPIEPCPSPLLSIRELPGELVELSWPSCPANTYQVTSTTNFVDWKALTPQLVAPTTNSTMTWTNSISRPAQFYRLLLTPVGVSRTMSEARSAGDQ